MWHKGKLAQSLLELRFNLTPPTTQLIVAITGA